MSDQSPELQKSNIWAVIESASDLAERNRRTERNKGADAQWLWLSVCCGTAVHRWFSSREPWCRDNLTLTAICCAYISPQPLCPSPQINYDHHRPSAALINQPAYSNPQNHIHVRGSGATTLGSCKKHSNAQEYSLQHMHVFSYASMCMFYSWIHS